jgi:hypothetical protein
MVVMLTVPPLALDAGALLAPAAGALVAGALVAGALEDELAELPHADRARARAASPAAPNIFRIRILLFTVLVGLPWGVTYQSAVQFTFMSAGLVRRQFELVEDHLSRAVQPTARRSSSLPVITSPYWGHGR